MAVLLAAINPYIAAFYGRPDVTPILLLHSFNFMLIRFAFVTMMLLQGNMRFDLRSRIQVSSAVMHLVTAVACAWHGLGSMSLALAAVANILTTIVLSGRYSPRKRLPARPARSHHFRQLYDCRQLVSEHRRVAPELILGRRLGMTRRGRSAAPAA